MTTFVKNNTQEHIPLKYSFVCWTSRIILLGAAIYVFYLSGNLAISALPLFALLLACFFPMAGGIFALVSIPPIFFILMIGLVLGNVSRDPLPYVGIVVLALASGGILSIVYGSKSRSERNKIL
jgi:hypothetical protein